MNIYLDTIGCRLNEAELQSWARRFRGAGHSVVGSPEAAGVLVLNTCAVTGEAARKSRQFLRRFHRRNPSAPIVVTGCFAELEPETASALPGVDLVIGNHDKDRLAEIVIDALGERDSGVMPDLATDPGKDASHVYAEGRTRAFVKVQDGCRHRCTFCIVTVARGEERSRSRNEIIEEINDLDRAGYREIVLTGVHLGGYGSDLGTTLRDLVETVLRETSVPRIRLSSLEPWDLPPDFWSLWGNDRLMPHLHLPLQSGSDRVLRGMGRRCDLDGFRRLVRGARESIDALTVTTDIIVGFPGETEDDWQRGLEVIEEIGFGHVHVFAYSPRSGTAAAKRGDQVSAADRKERSRQLHALTARMKHEHLGKFTGTIRPVLWESAEVLPTDSDPYGLLGNSADAPVGDSPPVRWRGYTDNYLRVETSVPAEKSLRNVIEKVHLTRVEADRLIADAVRAGSPRAILAAEGS